MASVRSGDPAGSGTVPAVRTNPIGPELEVWRKLHSGGQEGFLIVWLLVWTLGCGRLVHLIIEKPEAQIICFAIPFWAAWFLVAFILLCMVGGFERLRLGPDGVEYAWGLFVPLGQRRVPLREVKNIRAYARVIGKKSGATERGLKVETLGRPIRFARRMKLAEREWLAFLLSERLRALAPPGGPATAPGSNGTHVEILRPAEIEWEPPSDCRIHLEPGWEGFSLVRRYPTPLGAVGRLTFQNLVYHGIVAFFVARLVEGQVKWGFPVVFFLILSWNLTIAIIVAEIVKDKMKEGFWRDVFFLLFVALAGLYLLAIWCLAITQPLWRRRWTFRDGEVRTCLSILGLGLPRRYACDGLERIELRRVIDTTADAEKDNMDAMWISYWPLDGEQTETDWEKGRRILRSLLGVEPEEEMGRDGCVTLALLDRAGGELLRVERVPEERAEAVAERCARVEAKPLAGSPGGRAAILALVDGEGRELLPLGELAEGVARRLLKRFRTVEVRKPGRHAGRPQEGGLVVMEWQDPVLSTANDPESDQPFALALVARGGSDLLVLKGLTEGEGRWIADLLFQAFPHWFAS